MHSGCTYVFIPQAVVFSRPAPLMSIDYEFRYHTKTHLCRVCIPQYPFYIISHWNMTVFHRLRTHTKNADFIIIPRSKYSALSDTKKPLPKNNSLFFSNGLSYVFHSSSAISESPEFFCTLAIPFMHPGSSLYACEERITCPFVAVRLKRNFPALS